MQKIKLSRSSAWALKGNPWVRARSDEAVLRFQVFPGLFKAMRPSHWGLVFEESTICGEKAFPPFDGATYEEKERKKKPTRTVNND